VHKTCSAIRITQLFQATAYFLRDIRRKSFHNDTQYGFLIPSNMFAVVSLRQLAEIEREVYDNLPFAEECTALADEVDAAIRRYGTFNHPVCGRIYAFEVDGFGNALCMDDANVPCLLAAPYLGYCSFKDAVYRNTRKMIWSENNPYFFKGKAGEGVGGPHVGLNYIWPMSIIMKAFTTDVPEEIRSCLKQLRDTDGGTGFYARILQLGECR
jgi:uncharacterized protein